MSRQVDVFIDLTGATLGEAQFQRFVEQWQRPDRIASMARRVACVASAGGARNQAVAERAGWRYTESESAVQQLAEAMATAGRHLAPLLVIVGPVQASAEAVAHMQQILERDPLFGFALPRVACAKGCCLVRFSRHGLGEARWVPRRILADLPETEVIAEAAGPCLLVRAEVLANFDAADGDFETVTPVMLYYLATARRCGFRTVLCNRAVVEIDDLTCERSNAAPLNPVSGRDEASLRNLVPDLDRGWQEFRAGSWERFEALYDAAVNRGRSSFRRSLLLDIRNVAALFNGTAQSVLSTLDAFHKLKADWEVAVVAAPEGAAFHDLERRYAGWPVYTAMPDRAVTVAIRLSQPWHIQDVIDLHRRSLFNGYFMHDTIGWDVVYAATPHLDATWRFISDYADALIFNSDFTRQRFGQRFPAGRAVPGLVTLFSVDPREYVREDATPRNGYEESILVVGNQLDHKDVRQTVGTLAAAFPFQPIVALGPTPSFSTAVKSLRSGRLPDAELHQLYATAKYVVFPSFYEGFGFPIVTALAYGRTVLARRSSLVEELSAHCVQRGRLVLFDTREELVRLIGRLMHGDPVSDHPLGQATGTNGTPRQWRNVAEDILRFLESIVDEPSRSRWLSREHAICQLLAHV